MHKTGTGESKSDPSTRPDVTITGTLRVGDGEAFGDLGRTGGALNQPYGYGMLKVRRA